MSYRPWRSAVKLWWWGLLCRWLHVHTYGYSNTRCTVVTKGRRVFSNIYRKNRKTVFKHECIACQKPTPWMYYKRWVKFRETARFGDYR